MESVVRFTLSRIPIENYILFLINSSSRLPKILTWMRRQGEGREQGGCRIVGYVNLRRESQANQRQRNTSVKQRMEREIK